VQDELQAANRPLELLLSQKAGPLTKQQQDALQETQAALQRMVRATEKTVPPVTPKLNKR
jgi:hypothetical protein